MTTKSKRLIALLTIPLLLLLSSCMRMKADYEILNEDEVRVSVDFGMQNEFVTQMGSDVPDFCDQEGLTDIEGVTSEEYAEDGDSGYQGCKLTGVVKIGDINDGDTVLQLENGEWTFHMKGSEQDAEGLSSEMFSDFEIKVTFPGEVLTHSGASTVSGNTVTWDDPNDLLSSEGLKATATNAGGGAALPWVWIVIGIVVVAAVITGAVLLTRRNKPATAPYGAQPGGPQYPQGDQFASVGQPYPEQQAGQPYPQQPMGQRYPESEPQLPESGPQHPQAGPQHPEGQAPTS